MKPARVKCPDKKCYHYQGYLVGDCPAFYLKLGCTHQEEFKILNKPKPHRYTKFGLSPAEQDSLLKQQNKRCAICGKKLQYPHLDHDHKTGKARGYLCPRCNAKLAGIEDEEFRIKALEYLDNSPAEQFYT